jgi:hypothetical protein
MKHLLYCILRDPALAAGGLPPGVDGAAVFVKAEAGLAAAYSVVSDASLSPSVPRAMAFARVVESFHRDRPVVPFRYGCFLDGQTQVVELIRARRRELEASLDALAGYVEMSLRVLLEEEAPEAPRALKKVPDTFSSGRAYLADRRNHYAALDATQEQAGAAADGLRRAFEGLFVRSEVEPSRGQASHLLSLYFLVSRERVGAFREAFRELRRRRPERMLLTGPWPPYNFVDATR